MSPVDDSAVEPPSTGKKLLGSIGTNVIVLGIVSLLTDMSSEMIYPVLPLFLLGIGATYVIIGLIEGAAEATASFLKVISGWYSDRTDRRKPFILAGYSASAVVKPFLVFATSPWHVFGIRVSERIGKGVRSAPRDALIADSTDENVRGLAFGFHKAMDSLGAIIGPIIALVIILVVAMSQMDTFRLIFALAVIPAVLGVIVIVFFVREKKKATRHSAVKFTHGLKQLDRSFWLLMLVVLAFYIGEISYAFFVLKAQVEQEDLVMTIALYVLFNVFFVLVSIPAGQLSDRLGRKPVILGAFLLFALTCVVMSTASSLAFLAVGFALFGVYKGASEGVFKAYVVDVVPEHSRGTALGAFHTVVGLAALPGGLVAGLLWEYVGSWATFAYGAATAVLAFVLLVLLGPGNRARHHAGRMDA